MGNCIILRKSGGFYQAFDNDAIIINYLTNYKIINGRVGFPLNAFDKVINTLEDNKINYMINEENIKKNYKTNNKYKSILEKGKKKRSIEYRIACITNKLDKLSIEELEEVLSKIEEYVNE